MKQTEFNKLMSKYEDNNQSIIYEIANTTYRVLTLLGISYLILINL